MTRIAAWVGAATALAATALADGMPELPRGKGLTCVEPLDVMRRNHMDFLNHERDLTVRGGIRGRKHSLVGCIACHAQRAAGDSNDDGAGEFIRIDAPGQFCHACHEFTGVRMDCFECHAAVPDTSAAEAPGLQFPLGRGNPDAKDGNLTPARKLAKRRWTPAQQTAGVTVGQTAGVTVGVSHAAVPAGERPRNHP